MNGPETAYSDLDNPVFLTTTTAHVRLLGLGGIILKLRKQLHSVPSNSPGTAGVQYAFTNWATDAYWVALTSNAITMSGPKTASGMADSIQLNPNPIWRGSDYTGNLIIVNGSAYTASGYSTWAT